uniref:Apple domain-containing protein n=1 Tax=Wuchereria bancrofti TaxID=6293 RepID=A0A1I8EF35_WUCBA
MVNKVQRECILSKWSPNLATFSKYHSKVVYTVFYQNICIPPLDQVQNFTVVPPRTTFSIPITNTRLFMPNSINDKIKNHKSIGVVHDSTVNMENKKKLSFETVFHAAQHVPSPNTINGNIHRQLNGYRREIIKQIGLQDCLHNCILRISFLCLSVNYNKKTRECILNDGNRIINNVQLISSKLTNYYEYVCLNAQKQGLKAKNTRKI